MGYTNPLAESSHGGSVLGFLEVVLGSDAAVLALGDGFGARLMVLATIAVTLTGR
jgi:hypothetical protein